MMRKKKKKKLKKLEEKRRSRKAFLEKEHFEPFATSEEVIKKFDKMIEENYLKKYNKKDN